MNVSYRLKSTIDQEQVLHYLEIPCMANDKPFERCRQGAEDNLPNSETDFKIVPEITEVLGKSLYTLSDQVTPG